MRLVHWSLLLLLALCAACGAKPESARPNFRDQPTRARNIHVEERDSTGALNWYVRAESLVSDSNALRGDSLLLVVMEAARSSKNGRGVSPEAQNCSGVSAGGSVFRSDKGTRVILDRGYRLSSADGWLAEGEILAWDGTYLTATEGVAIVKGDLFMKGTTAHINPRERRFVVTDASGHAQDFAL